MTISPLPDPEHFPAEFSAGERAVLTAMKAWQEEASEKQEEHHAENRARLDAMDREVKAVAATQKLAFPDGDADGHRRYHEELIEEAAARKQFYRKLLISLAEKGLWSLMILLAVSVWFAVKEKFLK